MHNIICITCSSTIVHIIRSTLVEYTLHLKFVYLSVTVYAASCMTCFFLFICFSFRVFLTCVNNKNDDYNYILRATFWINDLHHYLLLLCSITTYYYSMGLYYTLIPLYILCATTTTQFYRRNEVDS